MSAKVYRLDKNLAEVREITRLEKFTKVGDYTLRNNESGYIYVRRKYLVSEGIPELFVSTKQKQVGKAKTEAQNIMREWEEFHSGKPIEGPNRFSLTTVGQVVDRLLEFEIAKKRNRTGDNYRLYLGKIKKKFGDVLINAITQKKFDDWIEEERKRPRIRILKDGSKKELPPRRTFFDYAKYMNLLMTYAYQMRAASHHMVFSDPDRILKNQLTEKQKLVGRRGLSAEEKEILELGQCRVLSKAEIKALWAVMNEDTRDQFVLAYTCFMRLREAIEAPWVELNLLTGVWNLPAERVKTGHARSFQISEQAHERLKARFKRQGGTSRYIFPGWSKKDPGVDKPVNQNKDAWKRAKKKAGIKGRCRWHDLRHTALTHALLGDESLPVKEREAMKRDPLEVSKYAGVSRQTIDKVYLHAESEHTRKVSTALRIEF
jgi:integrase